MRFNRFIYLVLLLLWLLATKSTKYIGEKKKTGNFNRGKSLDSPHTGYGPVIGNFDIFWSNLLKHFYVTENKPKHFLCERRNSC